MRGRSFRRPVAAVLVCLAAAGGLLTAAVPAQGFDGGLDNKVQKLKTVWGGGPGGGLALNTGDSAGTTSNGAQAKVHRNVPWDNASRWTFTHHYDDSFGTWYTLRNNVSGMCLTAEAIGDGTGDFDHPVVQRPCKDPNHPESNDQFWTFDRRKENPDGTNNGVVRNYQYHYWAPSWAPHGWSLTQNWPEGGSLLYMQPHEFKITQYWVRYDCPPQEWC